MSKYGNDVIASMKEANTGDSVGSVRWFFENVAMPYLFYRDPKAVIEGVKNDPLEPFRLLDEMIKGMGLENKYTLTPEMTYTGEVYYGDNMLVIALPDPTVIAHSCAIIMFTNKDFEYPAYFLVTMGANNNLYLTAWDYDMEHHNFGILDLPENAPREAYDIYRNSMPET